MQERKNKNVRNRKNSHIPVSKGGGDFLAVSSRKAILDARKASYKGTKASGSQLKRNSSSYEGTLSSCSIDFEKMDKHREETMSEVSKLVS